MKTYVKPDIEVTAFMLNEAIAACTPTSETKYDEQNISCAIVSGEAHGIFYDGCSSYANGYLKTVSGVTYYVWQDGSVGGRPDSAGEDLIKLLGIPGPGYHAGVASPTIISIVNAS